MNENYEVIRYSKEYERLVSHLHYNSFYNAPLWSVLFPNKQEEKEEKEEKNSLKWIMIKRVQLTSNNIYLLRNKQNNLIVGCVTMEFKQKKQEEKKQRNSLFNSLKLFLKLLFEFIYLFGFIELLLFLLHLLFFIYSYYFSSEIKSSNISIKDGYWYLSCYAFDPSIKGKGLGKPFLENVYSLLRIQHPIVLDTQYPKLAQYYENLGFIKTKTRVKKIEGNITPISYRLIKPMN